MGHWGRGLKADTDAQADAAQLKFSSEANDTICWAASQPHSDFDAGDEDADREPSSQAILLLMQKLKKRDAVSV